jgi:hypothetical protein
MHNLCTFLSELSILCPTGSVSVFIGFFGFVTQPFFKGTSFLEKGDLLIMLFSQYDNFFIIHLRRYSGVVLHNRPVD